LAAEVGDGGGDVGVDWEVSGGKKVFGAGKGRDEAGVRQEREME
jgi:hypothetical protein